MKYNLLKNCGIRISEISFGPWNTISKNPSLSNAKKLVSFAFENGVNYFDNAERHGYGETETLMGKSLEEFPRDELIIGTKLYWGGEKPNQTGLSRKHLHDGLHNSLRRLKVDYIDILLCHRYDETVPLFETAFTFDNFIRQGKVLYWGTSEWTSTQLLELNKICERYNLIKPVCAQVAYNYLNYKRVQEEYQSLYSKLNLNIIAHSPLNYGILSGKYINGINKGTRLYEDKRLFPKDLEFTNKKLQSIKSIVNKYQLSMTQFALLWSLNNSNVCTVLSSFRKIEQFTENIKIFDLKENFHNCLIEFNEKNIIGETNVCSIS